VETTWTNLTETIERNIPSKYTTTRWNLPWMTTEIKQMIRKKQRLYNKAKKSNDKEHWNNFKLYRKNLKDKLQNAHDDYVKNIPTPEETKTIHIDSSRDQIYTTTKKFWSYIKGMEKDSSNISMLKKEGKDIISAEEKANVLNQQYESVFSDIDFNQYINIRYYADKEFRLPTQTTETNWKIYETHKCDQTWYHKATKKHLLYPSKATGPDLISCRVLKEAADSIAPYLEILYNKSIKTGKVPVDWLIGTVIPIFKKGDKTDPANYRLVSLTSVPCKIMEHIIFSAVMKHFDDNKILSYQYGFSKNHSCEHQLINTTEDLAKIRDQKVQADVLILDFSKALDTVPHRHLIHKLRHNVIDSFTVNWIENWLQNRKQSVLLDGSKS
jgi:hypothetical protein